MMDDESSIFRIGKRTPKKLGWFVTCYKRLPSGVIAPYDDKDLLQCLIVEVVDKETNRCGKFTFTKAVLIENGIMTAAKKEGKRGFRLYSPWCATQNKTACATQKWQSNCFKETAILVDQDSRA